MALTYGFIWEIGLWNSFDDFHHDNLYGFNIISFIAIFIFQIENNHTMKN